MEGRAHSRELREPRRATAGHRPLLEARMPPVARSHPSAPLGGCELFGDAVLAFQWTAWAMKEAQVGEKTRPQSLAQRARHRTHLQFSTAPTEGASGRRKTNRKPRHRLLTAGAGAFYQENGEEDLPLPGAMPSLGRRYQPPNVWSALPPRTCSPSARRWPSIAEPRKNANLCRICLTDVASAWCGSGLGWDAAARAAPGEGPEPG